MSFADYSQTYEDHRSLLILVRPVGAIKVTTFNEIFERINTFNEVYLPGESGGRRLRLRYKRTYPVENNAWGEFQAHRKVLGLVCVTTIKRESEYEEAYKHYEILRDKYASSLFDSRILLFWEGSTNPATPTTPSTFFNPSLNRDGITDDAAASQESDGAGSRDDVGSLSSSEGTSGGFQDQSDDFVYENQSHVQAPIFDILWVAIPCPEC
jgi:hypothetical protein